MENAIFKMLATLDREIILFEKIVATQALYQSGDLTEEEKEQYRELFRKTIDRPLPLL